MKFLQILPAFFILGGLIIGCSSKSAKSQSHTASKSILIFSKTEGFRHQSIPTGVKAVKKLASEHDVKAFHTENAAYFQPDSLARFDAVVFLNTTGNILNAQQQDALKKFIQEGAGYVGVHAAADTEFNWPWYGKMVGAYFDGHPQIQQATVNIVDKNHPSTSFLSDKWVRTDEWYNYKQIDSDINVLLNLDESSYQGGTNGRNHPIAWYHEFEDGRIFYTGGGHTKESYAEDRFLKHLWGGIRYVLGNG